MSQRDITFVTGFVALEGRRGLQRYYDHLDHICRWPFPTVYFLDETFRDAVRVRRDRLGLGAQTQIVPTSLSELHYRTGLSDPPRIHALLNNGRNFVNRSHTTDTPEFLALTWNKFPWVARVVQENPFGTDHFGWVDFGISHVAKPRDWGAMPCDRGVLIRLLEMRAVPLSPPEEFFRAEQGRLAGGFLTGSSYAWRQLTVAFDEQLQEFLSRSIVLNEQTVLASVMAASPSLFAPYYGDYPEILVNHGVAPRDWSWVMGLNIRSSLADGNDAHARAIARKCLFSMDGSQPQFAQWPASEAAQLDPAVGFVFDRWRLGIYELPAAPLFREQVVQLLEREGSAHLTRCQHALCPVAQFRRHSC